MYLCVQASLALTDCEVKWLKDSEPVEDERTTQEVKNDTAVLCIEVILFMIDIVCTQIKK